MSATVATDQTAVRPDLHLSNGETGVEPTPDKHRSGGSSVKVVQVLIRDASEPRDGVVLHGEEEDQRCLSVCLITWHALVNVSPHQKELGNTHNSTESVGDVDLSHRP